MLVGELVGLHEPQNLVHGAAHGQVVDDYLAQGALAVNDEEACRQPERRDESDRGHGGVGRGHATSRWDQYRVSAGHGEVNSGVPRSAQVK